MATDVICVTFKINGTLRQLEVQAHHTLANVLREQLGLLGTKVSCGEGECGACTVIVDGKAVNSCIMLAPEVDGREVVTIEGLAAEGELDPIQMAFIEEGAVQCGFCTPGMIMSTKALLMEKPDPSVDQIREALAGNLCRCTGYHRIVNAVLKSAPRCKG
ncbi:(2Fe-2S)-binding protein [Sporomusa sp.]|uniref:(2Fe-2S)-binding protein n=1 Tax=Sporomusa sp. TaxID=2078658 RepID=UPI002BDAFDA5|nr:(2Fe-2S)-binding protein [Sporomusa sp.]MDF2874026.1 ndhS [Sporomusa sp.]HWR07397.1 (2Fe-2S)-binding protein [Sporomusa sp.]